MKKISMYSLIIGVGVGIMITSIFNIVWIQLENNYLKSKDTDFGQVYNISTNANTTEAMTYEGSDKLTTLESNSNEDENKDNVKLSEHVDNNEIDEKHSEIFIAKGMLSEEIANLLETKGIIKNGEEFNNLANKLNLTKKFQYGVKRIPTNSSLDEIMLILTK